MSACTPRIAIWSALLSVLFAACFSIAALAANFTTQIPAICVNPLSFAPSLLLAWSYLVLMACVLDAAPPEHRVWALLALCFAVLYATMNTIVYVACGFDRRGRASDLGAPLRDGFPCRGLTRQVGQQPFWLQGRGAGQRRSVRRLVAGNDEVRRLAAQHLGATALGDLHCAHAGAGRRRRQPDRTRRPRENGARRGEPARRIVLRWQGRPPVGDKRDWGRIRRRADGLSDTLH